MKKSLLKRYNVIMMVVLVGFGFLFCTSPAQALTIIPPSMEIDLTPGVPYNDQIKLFNETDYPVTLYTEITNFTASDDGTKPQYEFGLELTDVATWIQVEPGPFVLQPKERRSVPFIINPPAEADPGGHYAIIFFSNNPPQIKEPGKVKIGSKLGTLILSNVAGDITEAGSIDSFLTVDKSVYFNYLPVQLQLTFNNTGNVHIRPSGTITIQNIFGKTVKTLDINTVGSATLPKTARSYQTVWEKAPVLHTTNNWLGQFWEELKNEKDNFAFGKYTASASLVAGQDNQITKQAVVSFWVIPWRLLIIFCVGAIIILLGLIRMIKGYNRWIIRHGQSK
ncbi:MAG: hypothetical protein WCV88_02420 [Patescibacteria group bacterium]|jgi:hypothetical protein